MELTERQKLFLKSVRDYESDRGYSWDAHDIGKKVGIGISEVDKLVLQLEEGGFISKSGLSDIEITNAGRKALENI
jgi:predicted transcriptional regulator